MNSESLHYLYVMIADGTAVVSARSVKEKTFVNFQ